jgi:hypothetical protein
VDAKSKYLKEHPTPSVVYVVPSFWSPSPSASWLMKIRHCGPDSVYNVEVIFTDADRAKQIATRGSATPAVIAATLVSLEYPEIDPTQGGWAEQFPWSPLDPDHEHYTAKIKTRDKLFDETLQIERVAAKWLYRIKIFDPATTQRILDCRDPGFPESPVEPLPVCFPHYVSGSHQDRCG